jgi:hypothetical protein
MAAQGLPRRRFVEAMIADVSSITRGPRYHACHVPAQAAYLERLMCEFRGCRLLPDRPPDLSPLWPELSPAVFLLFCYR